MEYLLFAIVTRTTKVFDKQVQKNRPSSFWLIFKKEIGCRTTEYCMSYYNTPWYNVTENRDTFVASFFYSNQPVICQDAFVHNNN